MADTVAGFKPTARPDSPDLRDRLYNPMLRGLPQSFNAGPDERWLERVKFQGQTEACTGFALSAMVERLLAEREQKVVSPYMIYYFARRYDEYPGEADVGSSARAAMKAWHRHGACDHDLWPEIEPARVSLQDPWVGNAFLRPLGSYYRVDHTSIPDVHAAINETGAVYATAYIHNGWGIPDNNGTIHYDAMSGRVGGHAFLITGYDEDGFWIQNSWDRKWGLDGFARLTYADWGVNAMDAWVAQVGVHISSHVNELMTGLTLDTLKQGGKAQDWLSSSPSVRAQQVNPYVVDLGNNGLLSDNGRFRTTDRDLHDLCNHFLDAAITDFGLGANDLIDVALYAHGGLNNEEVALDAATRWVPELYRNKIYPVFFMWETGFLETITDIIEDAITGQAGAAGAGWWDRLWNNALDWKDDRIEGIVAKPAQALWDEMKQNAAKASVEPAGGIRKLYEQFMQIPEATRRRMRFHLIGHSAGAIFHSHLIGPLVGSGLNVDGVYFMAPAVTVDGYRERVLPCLGGKGAKAFAHYYMTDKVEQDDNCGTIYNKSLLYLVMNACERRRGTPILGMERNFDGAAPPMPDLRIQPAGMEVWKWVASPQAESMAMHHGDFDDDWPTIHSIINTIKRLRPAGLEAVVEALQPAVETSGDTSAVLTLDPRP